MIKKFFKEHPFLSILLVIGVIIFLVTPGIVLLAIIVALWFLSKYIEKRKQKKKEEAIVQSENSQGINPRKDGHLTKSYKDVMIRDGVRCTKCNATTHLSVVPIDEKYRGSDKEEHYITICNSCRDN